MDARFTSDIIDAGKAGQRKYYVPGSVTDAQWAVESAYGRAMPAGSNNPFGIKWNGTGPYVEATTREVIGGVSRTMVQKFAKYASLTDAFEAHAHLLATVKLYAPAMAAWRKGDLKGGVVLMAQHYATDPHYAATILSVINTNGLAVFDRAVALEGSGTAAAVKAVAKPVTVPVAASAASVAVATATTGHLTASAGFAGLAALSALVSWLLHKRPAAPAPAVVATDRVPLASVVQPAFVTGMTASLASQNPAVGYGDALGTQSSAVLASQQNYATALGAGQQQTAAANAPSPPAAPAAAASALSSAAQKAPTMDLSTIVTDVAGIIGAGSNPIGGMLSGAKIALGALPTIFNEVEAVAEHLPEIEAKFADLVAKLEAAYASATHLDFSAVQSDIGAAWQDGAAIYDLVGLPRALVQQVVAVAAGDNKSPSFVTEAENVAKALAKQLGIAVA